jgi:flagellin-like protein
MKKLMANRKAVSPVIATLLVIAIAVAAALLVYVWAMGLIGGLQTGGGEQVTEQITLDVYDWNASSGSLEMYLRNVGRSEITVDELYVSTNSGIEVFDGPGASSGGTGDIAIGTYEVFTCPVSASSLTPGASYTIKVVTESGGVFTYSAVAGRAA